MANNNRIHYRYSAAFSSHNLNAKKWDTWLQYHTASLTYGACLNARRFKMTSSNGNIFCVTGPLCGEFTGHRWIPLTKPVTRALMFPLTCTWTSSWVNNRNAGDLRYYRAHYNVIAMFQLLWYLSYKLNWRDSGCIIQMIIWASLTKNDLGTGSPFQIQDVFRNRHKSNPMQTEIIPQDWPAKFSKS